MEKVLNPQVSKYQEELINELRNKGRSESTIIAYAKDIEGARLGRNKGGHGVGRKDTGNRQIRLGTVCKGGKKWKLTA